MESGDVRPDIVRALLQSCYVIERARSNVQSAWGGDFDHDAEASGQRASRLNEELVRRGIPVPEDVVGPHTDWFFSMCGSHPTEIPLGSGVLYQFGKWPTVLAAPYLGDDAEEFRELGTKRTRVDLEVRMMTREEAVLPPPELPAGRRFVVLTDIHVGSPGCDEMARRAVRDINELEPEFVVIPGDITEDGEPEQFHLAKEILDGLACPYFAVLGNHDIVQRSTREPRGDELFADAFGRRPEDHVVECGGIQVALVDTSDPTPSPFADWSMATGRVGGTPGGIDSGALREGQAEALAARVDRSKPVLLVQHHELHPFPGFPPVKFALREEDAGAELDALKDHNLIGVVAGHTHRSAVLGVGDGSVTQLELPSLKDWPYAYSVVGVGDDGVQVVPRQVSDAEMVWGRAQRLLPLMHRFALGPLADLRYTFMVK